MTILVTGGAGFIGSALVRRLITSTDHEVVVVDSLTYAANLDSLAEVKGAPTYTFERADICDGDRIRELFSRYSPAAIMHLAAESHVDRSIDDPGVFVRTNVLGTYTLLREATRHWSTLSEERRASFRFLHVSTDEVYGSLGADGRFTESSPYDPTSPYSASKAGSDHLVRAWHQTYGLPTIVTNCSNNYGPYQFPEKLIPLMILNALEFRPLPVYGRGENVRDWLHVDDHTEALLTVLRSGRVGETYLVGARCERRNIEVVQQICALVDDLAPGDSGRRSEFITFVEDRPGHDRRYAIDPAKIEEELGWRPKRSFEEGLRETVQWYLENRWWWERVRSGEYRGERLGLGRAKVV